MRESANARNRRNPYLKLNCPNGVTLIFDVRKLFGYIKGH